MSLCDMSSRQAFTKPYRYKQYYPNPSKSHLSVPAFWTHVCRAICHIKRDSVMMRDMLTVI